MRKIKEVLRLFLLLKLSHRAIGRSCDLSSSTVADYVGRAKVAQLSWPLPAELEDEEALERLLFRNHAPAIVRRPEPDWVRVHAELRRGRHVTKQLLWEEYRAEQPDGLGYSQFCSCYAGWARRLNVTMRQTHVAGEKMFVDFSGDGIAVFDVASGENRTAKLFVAVLGASNLTYVEPVFSEDLATWIGCHIRALEYCGGSPEIVVPDNLRAGVTRADRYDPEINPSYAEFAGHYGLAVIPARVRKPRDKAKVEQGVLLAERWILAALRHHHFGSLSALKEAVSPLVEKLNTRPMRRLKKSRRELFEQIERGALRPLPTDPFELANWAKGRLASDYHVEYEEHFYSAPHTLVDELVEVRATERMVEILHGGKRVAAHLRSHVAGGKTTLAEHMPRHHRELAAWTTERIEERAAAIGPETSELVKKIFESRSHREQGRRSSLGLLRLADQYPAERMEKACARALRARLYSRQSVLAILRRNLDSIEDDGGPAPPPVVGHSNLRGSRYYH